MYQQYFVTRCYNKLPFFNLFDQYVSLSFFQIGPGYDVVKNEFGYVCLTLTPVEPLMMRMVYHVYVRSPLFYFIGRISLYAWLTTVCSRYKFVLNIKLYSICLNVTSLNIFTMAVTTPCSATWSVSLYCRYQPAVTYCPTLHLLK